MLCFVPTPVEGFTLRADGRTVPVGESIVTDFCVVGGGPAGLTLARELDSFGHDVVLLERGTPGGAGLLEPIATTDAVGIEYDIDAYRAGGLGGSSHKWLVTTPLGDGFGRIPEFVPDDFEERAWIPYSGWPISKRDLVDYYPAARALFKEVSWPAASPEEAWAEEFGLTHRAGRLEGIEARVYPFASPAVFGGAVSRRLESSDRTLVLTDAAAVEFVGSEDGSRVDHLVVATDRERSFRVTASTYVLAAGGIESPRLLLASRRPWSTGLGNQHDLVGRFFMEHPRFTAGYFVPSAPGILEERAFYSILLRDGIPLQTKYRLDPATAAAEECANHTFFFNEARWSIAAVSAVEGWYGAPGVLASRRLRDAVRSRQVPDDPLRLLTDVVRSLPQLQRSLHVQRRLAAREARLSDAQLRQPDLLTVEVMAEQHPNPRSRVTLQDDVDRFGAPRASLDWRLTSDELEAFSRSLSRFSSSLEEAGLGHVHGILPDDGLPAGMHGASHHMGTTRMHRDPQHGVVDGDCRVHGVSNVYVAGSSVFATGGAGNPTLTLLALTLRLADHLKRPPS